MHDARRVRCHGEVVPDQLERSRLRSPRCPFMRVLARNFEPSAFEPYCLLVDRLFRKCEWEGGEEREELVKIARWLGRTEDNVERLLYIFTERADHHRRRSTAFTL